MKKIYILFSYLKNVASYTFHLFKDFDKVVSAKSYYPECELKSKWRIFFDQAFSIIKFGVYDRYYFLYGFDRREMNSKRMKKYITPYGSFSKVRDKLNLNPLWVKPNNYVIILNDKFIFERFLTSLGIATPKNLYYVDSGKIIDLSTNKYIDFTELISKEINVFVKPLAGMLGENIFNLKIQNQKLFKNNEPINEVELMSIFNSGKFIIQEKIKQHNVLDKIFPFSVNTMRIQSVLTEKEVIPFCVKIRFGNNNNFIDNWAKGGVLVGVDINTGKLHKDGFLKPEYGTRVTEHPFSKIKFEDFTVPYFHEAIELIKKAHSYFYGIHSIGWDVAITPDGPTIIEANHRWEISSTQATHGGLKDFFKENFKS